jgi:hypothetical protein
VPRRATSPVSKTLLSKPLHRCSPGCCQARIASNVWDHQHRWFAIEAVSRNMAESLAELLAQAAPRGPSALRSGQAGGAALALSLHCEHNLAWRPSGAAPWRTRKKKQVPGPVQGLLP